MTQAARAARQSSSEILETKRSFEISQSDNNEVLSEDVIRASLEAKKALDRARVWDVKTKIALRYIVTISVLALLFLQNYYVFNLVRDSIEGGKAPDLQFLFSALAGATLLESYKVLEIITNWLVKDINYD